MSEFRSTHAPRTGITAQVIHDLGRGMTVRECADAHHLPEAFIAQISSSPAHVANSTWWRSTAGA